METETTTDEHNEPLYDEVTSAEKHENNNEKPTLDEKSRSTILDIVEMRGLEDPPENVLETCQSLYAKYIKNFDETPDNFQLGHLVSAARMTIHFSEVIDDFAVNPHYLLESIAYRLSPEVLSNEPKPYLYQGDLTIDEINQLEERSRARHQEKIEKLAKKRESVMQYDPTIMHKSLVDEEIFYYTLRQLNRDRKDWEIQDPATYSLDDCYICKTPEKLAFVSTGNPSRKTVNARGFNNSEIGFIGILDDRQTELFGDFPQFNNLHISRVLYHELAMHNANNPLYIKTPGGEIEVQKGSEMITRGTSSERHRLEVSGVGLMEAIACLGDTEFARRTFNNAELGNLLVAPNAEAEILEQYFSEKQAYIHLRGALEIIINNIVTKTPGVSQEMVKETIFKFHQLGVVEQTIQYLDINEGDGIGYLFSVTPPSRGLDILEYAKGDSISRAEFIRHKIEGTGGVNPLKQNRNRRYLEEYRHNNRIDWEIARKKALQRLLPYRALRGIDPEDEDITVGYARWTRELLTEGMQKGADAATAILTSTTNDYGEGALGTEIGKNIRITLDADPSGQELLDELYKLLPEITTGVPISKAIPPEDSREYELYVYTNALSKKRLELFASKLEEVDLLDNDAEFMLGFSWALDEYHSALVEECLKQS